MYDRAQLIELFQEHALKFGDFTLASGRKSNYYLDKMQISLESRGLRLLCEGIFDLLDDEEFDAIGGMTIGADPIVGGVLTVAAERNRPLVGFLIRKEAKGYGTNRFVEGPVKPGNRVVIVEDVVTTGGSALLAVDRIEEFGCEVCRVVGVVDRLEGGAAGFAARNVRFDSLLTIEDLGLTPVAD